MLSNCGDASHWTAPKRGRKRVQTVHIRYMDPNDVPSIEERLWIKTAYENDMPVFEKADLAGAKENYKPKLNVIIRVLKDRGIEPTTQTKPTYRKNTDMPVSSVGPPKPRKKPVVIAIREDGIGMRFGRLTIIAKERTEKHYRSSTGYPCSAHMLARASVVRYYRVRCDCGNELVVTINELVRHKRKSCGCATSWSTGALAYAQRHPGTYRDEYGNYRDADSFLVMIRTRK